VIRATLFVSARRLQEQSSHTRKTALSSSPDEDFFCTLETNDGRRQVRTALFRRGDCSNKRHDLDKCSGIELLQRQMFLGMGIIFFL
jgi:hypothetical protein